MALLQPSPLTSAAVPNTVLSDSDGVGFNVLKLNGRCLADISTSANDSIVTANSVSRVKMREKVK